MRGDELQGDGRILYPTAIVKFIRQGRLENTLSTCCGRDAAAPGKSVAPGKTGGGESRAPAEGRRFISTDRPALRFEPSPPPLVVNLERFNRPARPYSTPSIHPSGWTPEFTRRGSRCRCRGRKRAGGPSSVLGSSCYCKYFSRKALARTSASSAAGLSYFT
jgi:hypothetical protein